VYRQIYQKQNIQVYRSMGYYGCMYPEVFKGLRKRGEKLLADHGLGELIFSSRTYQVEVLDPNHPDAWTFLQFDRRGKLRDRFCSCETKDCVHLAAALARIYGEHRRPLHERFDESFWNAVGTLVAYHADYVSPKKISKKTFRWKEGELECTIQGVKVKAQKELDKLIKDRVEETEETSIKFSGLDEEDLESWERGELTDHLRYELSVWADIARFFI